MSYRIRIILVITLTTALACGFMHHLVPPETLNFERLHIFLFNLCSGGTTLIYFTEGRESLSKKGKLFFFLSLTFAFCSFMKWYLPTLIIPLILAGIIENVRISHFGSFVPKALFSGKELAARKFHQASLLCLSIGLTLSSPVILNSVYGHWYHIEKLKLDTFFLGFSFPISLISMSVIFSLMQKQEMQITLHIKEVLFWLINLGVIIFFIFILAGWFVPQVMIATTLFVGVTIMLYLYYHQGIRLQQKAFLTSGILFLLITSVTGILYILVSFSDGYDPVRSQPLLRLHAFTALYGWNLSGLAVISRHNDFPIQLHSKGTIILHWVTVLVLCPLGFFFPLWAIPAVLCYGWLLITLLFNHGPIDTKLVAAEDKVLSTEPENPWRGWTP